jgi:hypothetical protein
MKSEEELIKEAFDNISPVSTLYITHLSDICDKVDMILIKKGWTLSDLAREMDMAEDKLNDWFTTIYPMTLREISHMEVVLGQSLITI